MSERNGAGDKMAAQVARADEGAEAIGAPRFGGDFKCYSKGPDGNPVEVWSQRFDNRVQRQGMNHILNVVFAADRASTNGPFVFLHNKAIDSTYVYSDVTGLMLTSLANGATSTNYATLSFPTTYKAAGDSGQITLSQSQSWQVLNGPQTVSGAGIFFYTAASCATNCNTTDVRLYAVGSFANTQQVIAGNSISATLTLSFNTA